MLASLIAVLVAAPFLFIGLGGPPFDDPGEGMHAEIARELLGSRDPLALRLNGVRYVDKPPLLYVMLAGAFVVGGPTEGVARAVSALAALIAIGTTAWLGARLLGPRAGLVAGGALLTSVGFFAYGRYVRPETLFLATLTLGFAAMMIGVIEAHRRLVIVGLVAFGLASLAKDPLGALAPLVVIGIAQALAGRAQPLGRWLPWPGVLGWLLLGFGWWLLAESRTPGFTWYTIIDNHVLNVAGARYFPDEDLTLSSWQFLSVAAVGAAPWVIGAATTVVVLVRRRAWRDPAETPWVVLGLWAIGVFALTAISTVRLPHYGLPAYPALALLAARGWQEHAGRAFIGAHALVLAALAFAAGLGWASDGAQFFASVMDATDVATHKMGGVGHGVRLAPWEGLRPLLGMASLACGVGTLVMLGVLVVSKRAEGRWSRALAVGTVMTTMLAVLPAVATGLARVSAYRAVREVALQIARHARADDLVAHEGPVENSGAFQWYSARRPVIVDGRRSVLGFGSTFADAKTIFWESAELRRVWDSGQRVWLVTTRAPDESLAAQLPGARLVTVTGGRWLYVNR